MKFKKSIYIVLLLLAGCTYYQEPQTGSKPLAVVSGSSEQSGVFTWSVNMITEIDKQPVNTFSLVGEIKSYNVEPGRHNFSVYTRFNPGVFGAYECTTEIGLDVKENQTYKFVSKSDGKMLKVWAEDRNGKSVSKIIFNKYTIIPLPIVTIS